VAAFGVSWRELAHTATRRAGFSFGLWDAAFSNIAVAAAVSGTVDSDGGVDDDDVDDMGC
jgi:hypothetical protein